MIGETISHYKITEKLGEGGMGVVYRAEDTKLERTVALKFLAAHLLNDDEAKERFLREAKAAAALSHPNICTVHEIDEANGRTFLAMEFVKGETLEDRIAKGPLSIKDALEIGRQVAEGLDAAHEAGIVHRDIKPANILIDPKGRATIMDFGLARLTEASRLTKADTTMGTVAYMSPEQAQGMDVDHRSDIWALGCVLYEMVSGQKPFKGVYDKALLYEIVHQEPEPLTGLRTGVPIELELLVGECLAKDRDDRTGTAQEVARKLRTLTEKLKSGRSTILRAGVAPGTPAASAGTSTGMTSQYSAAGMTVHPAEALPPDAVVVQRGRQRLERGLAAVATLAFFAVLAVHFTQAPDETVEQQVTRFSFSPESVQNASISPDGRYILYSAVTGGESSLWLRSLSDESARELPGTAGAIGSFWSPGSSTIGFAVGAPDYELKRVSLDGGGPITLCALPDKGTYAFARGTWSPDDQRIVFSSGLRMYEIAARGGQPQLLFDASDSPRPSSFAPHFLPTGSGPAALVYATSSSNNDHALAVLNLETGEHRELGPGSRPVYSLDGYLLHSPTDWFVGGRGLWALPFSLETLEPTGAPFPISTTGVAAEVSRNGTLAYLDTARVADPARTLVWRNRAGQILETVGQPQPNMLSPALSPEDQRVAVTSNEAGNLDIWVHDLLRSTKTRLTFDAGPERTPHWSPSGDEIVYWLQGADGSSLLRKAADGTGEAVALVEAKDFLPAPDWSRDGRYLVYSERNGDGNYDIRYLQFAPEGAVSEPVTFLGTPAQESASMLSPDGRFVAYVSNESGHNEIYVRPFPDGAGRWQASVEGGSQPRWSRDGTELYYVEGDVLMVVPVSTAQGVTLGQPQQLFESEDLPSDYPTPTYDVSADGQRFVTIASLDEIQPGASEQSKPEPPKIRVVQNWAEEFRDRERK